MMVGSRVLGPPAACAATWAPAGPWPHPRRSRARSGGPIQELRSGVQPAAAARLRGRQLVRERVHVALERAQAPLGGHAHAVAGAQADQHLGVESAGARIGVAEELQVLQLSLRRVACAVPRSLGILKKPLGVAEKPQVLRLVLRRGACHITVRDIKPSVLIDLTREQGRGMEPMSPVLDDEKWLLWLGQLSGSSFVHTARAACSVCTCCDSMHGNCLTAGTPAVPKRSVKSSGAPSTLNSMAGHRRGRSAACFAASVCSSVLMAPLSSRAAPSRSGNAIVVSPTCSSSCRAPAHIYTQTQSRQCAAMQRPYSVPGTDLL